VNAAVALVDILPVYALANWREFGGHSASAAARHSLLQCLRGEMRAGGVWVMSIFTGPVDDDWRQPLPPPKVAPAAIARTVVQALEHGIEESFVGDIAKDVLARWQDNPKVLERELQG
jgi:short-subunit dehydrogenase